MAIDKIDMSYGAMRYSDCLELIDLERNKTTDPIELLSLDIKEMKVAQRIGDFKRYYRILYQAQRRLHRMPSYKGNSEKLRRLKSVRSEMYIVESTYHYYLREDSLSRARLFDAEHDVSLEIDTIQWLNFHYMLGSGGYYVGPENIVKTLEESELRNVIAIAHHVGNNYFEANALQSLAEHTQNDSLAECAQIIFERCGDIFQMAATMRTRSEICFNFGDYERSLALLHKAYGLIELQHSRDSLRDLMWESRIYQRLVLTYAIMDSTEQMLRWRETYMKCLSNMSQNIGSEERRSFLSRTKHRLYRNVLNLCILLVFAFLIVGVLLYRLTNRHRRTLSQLKENITQTEEETECLREKLVREKDSNMERTDKVALAESVLPLIDRMLLSSTGADYMKVLIEEIRDKENQLTEWIRINAQNNNYSTHISSFSLKPILDSIRSNSATFLNKGVMLEVCDADVHVKADRILTTFMLNTICDNALKFTPNGGNVSVSVKEENDYVEVSVNDTGVGFAQSDSDKQSKGNGFGLASCEGIIQHYRKLSQRFSVCSIGHEDREEGGSRVWFRLAKIIVLVFLLSIPASASYGVDSLAIYNDRTIEALRQKDFSAYRYNNWQCIRLHNEATADPDLPYYNERINDLQQWIMLVRIGIVILFFSLLVTIVLILYFDRRRSKQWQLYKVKLEEAKLQQQRIEFEYERLYCQNNIIDNCLSTIKHETMYYPARISQMLESGENTQEQIHEVVRYYRNIYNELMTQLSINNYNYEFTLWMHSQS